MATVSLVALGACHDHLQNDHAQNPLFFQIRRVDRESPPPCAAEAFEQVQGGQVLHCYDLGPPALDARDVKSATVVVDPVSRADAVEFELSPGGVERFNALARQVGLGGQAAIVVDGKVVSAPKIQTTEFPGKGQVTGLTAAEARHLAQRLPRG